MRRTMFLAVLMAACAVLGTVTASASQGSPPVNQPPVFVSPTPGNGAVREACTNVPMFVTVAARDPDAEDTVSLSASGVPYGAIFDSPLPQRDVQAQLSWTPALGQVGRFTITFTAADNRGASTSRLINIDVSENCTPFFSRPPTPALNETFVVAPDQLFQVTVQASDANPEDLVWLTASGIPGNATFDAPLGGGHPVVGVLNWTPNVGHRGAKWTITFRATDSEGAWRETAIIVIVAPPFTYPIAPPQGACVCSLELPHPGSPRDWSSRPTSRRK